MSKVSAEEKLEPETNGAEGFQIPSNSDPHKTFNNDSVKKYYIIYDNYSQSLEYVIKRMKFLCDIDMEMGK